MDNIQSGLQTIQGSLSTLGDHVSELEQRVSSNEDNLFELQKYVKTLMSENSNLRDKVEDAENRCRAGGQPRRFFRIPEKWKQRALIWRSKPYIDIKILADNNKPIIVLFLKYLKLKYHYSFFFKKLKIVQTLKDKM